MLPIGSVLVRPGGCPTVNDTIGHPDYGMTPVTFELSMCWGFRVFMVTWQTEIGYPSYRMRVYKDQNVLQSSFQAKNDTKPPQLNAAAASEVVLKSKTPSSLVGNAMVVALVDNELGSKMSEEQSCKHYAKSLGLYKLAHKIVSDAIQASPSDPCPHGAGMRAVREYLESEKMQQMTASLQSSQKNDQTVNSNMMSTKTNTTNTSHDSYVQNNLMSRLSTSDNDTLAEIMMRVQQTDLMNKLPKQ